MASTITSSLHYLLLILLVVQFTHSAIIPKPRNGIAEHKPQPSNTYIVHTNHLSKPSQFATSRTGMLPWWPLTPAVPPTPAASCTPTTPSCTASPFGSPPTRPGACRAFPACPACRRTGRSIPRPRDRRGSSASTPTTAHGWTRSSATASSSASSTPASGQSAPASTTAGSAPSAPAGGASASTPRGSTPACATESWLAPRPSSLRPTASCPRGTNPGTARTCLGRRRLRGARRQPVGVLARERLGRGAQGKNRHVQGVRQVSVLWGEHCRGNRRRGERRRGHHFHVHRRLRESPLLRRHARHRHIWCRVQRRLRRPRGRQRRPGSIYRDQRRAVDDHRRRRHGGPGVPGETQARERGSAHRQSLYTMKAKGTGMIRLVYSSCNPKDLTPDNVAGKVVICKLPAGAWTGIHAQNAGGAGIVAMESDERLWDGVTAQPFALPGLTHSHTGGEKLNAYMASVPYPVASFSFSCDTVTVENRAPVVVGFSSRGPNTVVPEILKPDIVAPGLNILAAWSGDSSPSESDDDPRRVDYNIISGTSMACPHVAGVVALIKKKHGDWMPAMVRSAVMTTTWTFDNKKMEILDNGVVDIAGRNVMNATPLVAGAGLVRPSVAMDPGLVYDAGTQDYTDFLCTLNYTVEQMRRFVPDLTKCTRTLPRGVANLNYPSLVVVFDSRTHVHTLTRTVTKVSVQPETYNVTVVAPDGVKVTVTPTTLEFKQQNEKRNYTVEFRSEAGGNVKPGWYFGYITWESANHRVRSPVALTWEN